MAIAPKREEYRALVNLSVGRVERGPNGREESAERVTRGSTVMLTDQEAHNLGRFVRRVSEETSTEIPRLTAKQVVGKGVDKSGRITLDGSGALDMKDETRVYLTEAEADAEAQPTNNPSDPSYRGD